mgnify:CR=1 FL=1
MPETQTGFSSNETPIISDVLASPMDPITRHHYENLASGKEVRNKDGSVSTVYTIQVEINGKPTLIPTVWDGQIIRDQKEATDRAIASGINWPQRDTHAELRKFDQMIHERMEPISAEEAQKILDKSN